MSKRYTYDKTDKAQEIEYLNDFRKRAWTAMCEADLMRDLFDPNGHEYEKQLSDSGGEALSALFSKISILLCEAENLVGIDAAELEAQLTAEQGREITSSLPG